MVLAPTRTPETEVKYRKLFLSLVSRGERETQIVPFGPSEMVDRFLSSHNLYAPSTNRLHRAAIDFALDELRHIVSEAGAHYKADCIASALERLRAIDSRTGRRAQPTPSPKSKRKTSARKRKVLSREQAKAIADALEGRKHKFVSLAQGFMRFGPDLGLRPVEWQTATIRRGYLVVRNAKHTNDRACGPYRILNLRHYPAAYRDELQAFLDGIRAAVAAEGSIWDKVAEGVRRALHDASHAVGSEFPELRRQPVVLYTLRHVAAARMKVSGNDRISVAAMLGHASDETASKSYAHARSARGWPVILTKASKYNVARVRAVFVSLEDRQRFKLAAVAPASSPRL